MEKILIHQKKISFCQFQHSMLETNPMNNRDSSFVGLSLYSMCELGLFHKMGIWFLELAE
jgi:hypothetical protein